MFRSCVRSLPALNSVSNINKISDYQNRSISPIHEQSWYHLIFSFHLIVCNYTTIVIWRITSLINFVCFSRRVLAIPIQTMITAFLTKKAKFFNLWVAFFICKKRGFLYMARVLLSNIICARCTILHQRRLKVVSLIKWLSFVVDPYNK